MNNPIAEFEKIRDFYITYLETAFRIGSESIQERRRQVLEIPGVLATNPFLEPIPKYQSSNVRIDQLVSSDVGDKVLPGSTRAEREAFVRHASISVSKHVAQTSASP